MRIPTKTRIAALILGLLFAVQSCGPKQPSYVVCVVDVTGSIEPEAINEAALAIEAVVGRLKRGDTVAIIPITGDADSESPGRILRYTAGERREVYDADLKRLVDEAKAGIAELRAQALAAPARRSDVLGAVRLACEELASAGDARRTVVFLSDMIQDDARFNFKTAKETRDVEAARRLGGDLAAQSGARLDQTQVFVGLLRSTDYRTLPTGRRDAIRAFWDEYFRALGAVGVSEATDGPGRLQGFLDHSVKDEFPS